MIEILQWVATAATVAAAFITAANFGTRITGLGFGIFLIGSLAWLALGVVTDQPALIWTNAILTALNIFGMWRWLGRQAKVEQGAQDAAEKSAATPGETLFPLSLLTRAAVTGQGGPFGQCVDAMAGRDSGRIHYLVFSQGGVAGVGETLRRLDWDQMAIASDRVEARIAGGAESLPTVERDNWPSQCAGR